MDSQLQVVRALSPQATLKRGYALLTDGAGPVTVATTRAGQGITAHLTDGELDLTVTARRSNDE